MSVEATGQHQIVVGAHLGHGASVQYADHVGVSYGGQTVGNGDARSTLHGFVQGRLYDLRAENVG